MLSPFLFAVSMVTTVAGFQNRADMGDDPAMRLVAVPEMGGAGKVQLLRLDR